MWWRVVSVVMVVASVVGSSACSTVVRPTRPSQALILEGAPLPGVRFDGEDVQVREPGMPVAPSRAWQREVGNYTASALNTAIGAEDTAPTAQTIVSFDLASPGAFQIGTWKEMTITLTSTLPDGTVVRSAPVTANIDNGIEYAIVTSMGVGGTILDVTAGIASIFFIFQPSLLTGAIFIGALLGGLTLNVGQSTAQYFVAISEEGRWSDMYADALRVHAREVREQIGKGPPPRKTPPSTPLPPPPLSPSPSLTPTAPNDPSEPPPPLPPTDPAGDPPPVTPED